MLRGETLGLRLHRVGNIYKVARQIEPVGADVRKKSASAEARIVNNIVNAPNSPEKADAIYRSAPNVGALESPNKDKMIHGMIDALGGMYDDNQISDAHVARVAQAISRVESHMAEASHAAITKLVAENPQAGRFLVENSRSRVETVNRSDSASSTQNVPKAPKTKPVDVRSLSAAQEARLAAGIANNPDPYAKAAQLALYSNQVRTFEPKNRETIVNGAIETIKNERAPAEARSAISAVLLQSEDQMSSGQKVKLSRAFLSQARGGTTVVVDGAETFASRPNSPNGHDCMNARDALLHKDPVRTRSAGR